MNLAGLLARAARLWPDRPAVALGGTAVASYAEHADRATRLGAGLRHMLGLRTGDRAALAMSNRPAYSEAMFGIWHAGLAAVPMNARLHPRELAYILENSGARVCFASDDLAASVAEAARGVAGLERIVVAGSADYRRLFTDPPDPPAETGPDDLAWLFYTSGTTGRPKGAMLTHRNLMAMTLSYYADVDSVSERDAIVHAAPMSHGSGLYMMTHVAQGACQIVPESGGFDADELLALLRRYPGATVFAAPTMVMRLIDAPGVGGADAANLKTLVYGGGPMYAADCLRALDALGPRLVQIYGQGEAPMTITSLSRALHADTGHPRYRRRLASVGVARTGVEVCIAGADGRALPPGEAGEIGEVLVRGDVVMAGYWNDPDATAAALQGGWLHTGDLGAFDEDGFLTLKDRSKDVIISGGANIYPREVEEVLLTHPQVSEVSVVGRPHAEWGEDVVAFVVARGAGPPPEAELDALCLDNIARYKRPRAYRFVDDLPKNEYGKVLKTALRDALPVPGDRR